MKELDDLYRQFLIVGFIVLRQAADTHDLEWINAELELLHNVPSLIGESNSKRHEYFWNCERTAYIKWASASGKEQPKSRMRTYYEPIWRKMESLIPKEG